MSDKMTTQEMIKWCKEREEVRREIGPDDAADAFASIAARLEELQAERENWRLECENLREACKRLEAEKEQWEVNWDKHGEFDLIRDLLDGKPVEVAPACNVLKRVEELQTVVDKLPKTADGVLMLPGMDAYTIEGRKLWVRICGSTMACLDPDTDYWEPENNEFGPNCIYSTEAAALATKESEAKP